MIVLGCETSCDETGLAVFETGRAPGDGLRADVLHSQVDLHALYGGVVPELASRDHVRRLVPLARAVLADAGVAAGDLDGVAYTAGPGLAGALMSGALAARALAWALDVPALGVHHMEGHLLSPMLEPEAPPFPFVCLLVSGGHTQLVRVDGIGRYRLLGQSIDDAAGEAFDKTAKMLGLPYPGGAALARLAERGDPDAVPMPRPMLDRPGLDMSFSGLKTAAITRFRAFDGGAPDRPAGGSGSNGTRESFTADLAAGFEAAIVEVLAEKCRRALAQEGLSTLVVAGGVSANARLRAALERVAAESSAGRDGRADGRGERGPTEGGAAGVRSDEAMSEKARSGESGPDDGGGRLFCPRLAFCTDNGAMIALAGALRLAAGERTGLDVTIRPRWPLDELAPI